MHATMLMLDNYLASLIRPAMHAICQINSINRPAMHAKMPDNIVEMENEMRGL